MQRKGAGLEEVFRLYVLSRSLPGIRTLLADLVQLYTDEHSDNDSVNDVSRKTDAIRYRFLHPLERMAAKFTLYQQFTEQLLDFDRLPTLEVQLRQCNIWNLDECYTASATRAILHAYNSILFRFDNSCAYTSVLVIVDFYVCQFFHKTYFHCTS